MLKTKVFKYIELVIFYGGLYLNLWILFHFTFWGLGDGPSHLYYSKVIQYLLSGNSFLSQYFVLNRLPVPNITDHYFLALLDIFFQSVISGKILLFIFVIGFPLVFRYIIYKYNPDGLAASSFIIPFTHSALIYSGWYNFCISFTFLFVAIYYYFKNFQDVSRLYPPIKYILFFLLILLNYFTNGLSFLFLFFICGITEIYRLMRQRKPKLITNLYVIKRFLLFVALWTPAFIMLNIFSSSVSSLHHTNTLQLSFSELVKWIYDFKCLFVYDKVEYFYTHIIFYWLLITLSISIFYRLKNKARLKIVLTDIFFLLSLFTLIGYFLIPQGAGVGMISDRLFYYLIIFLLLWISLQKNNSKIILLLSSILISIHFLFFFNTHYPLLKLLNTDAHDIQEASAYVAPNSIVYPLRILQNPMEVSLSNILGMDKPLVILEKYEPDYGWFAVNRTMGAQPEWVIGRLEDNKLAWVDTKQNKIIKKIDYILVFGNYNETMKKGTTLLKYTLHTYTKVFSTADDRVHILRLNQDK